MPRGAPLFSCAWNSVGSDVVLLTLGTAISGYRINRALQSSLKVLGLQVHHLDVPHSIKSPRNPSSFPPSLLSSYHCLDVVTLLRSSIFGHAPPTWLHLQSFFGLNYYARRFICNMPSSKFFLPAKPPKPKPKKPRKKKLVAVGDVYAISLYTFRVDARYLAARWRTWRRWEHSPCQTIGNTTWPSSSG